MGPKSDTMWSNDENSKRWRMFKALVAIVVCPTLLLILLWLLIAFNVYRSLMSSTSVGKLHPKKMKMCGF